MTTRAAVRTFSYASDSRMDRGCLTSHLWLYNGTGFDGALPKRAARVAPVCETKCGHTCETTKAVCGAKFQALTGWEEMFAPISNVARSMVPFCQV